jgi:hypothetical protein
MDVVYRGTFLELRDGEDDSPSRRVRSEERPWESPNGRRINHLADLWSEVRKDEIKSFFDGLPSSQTSPHNSQPKIGFGITATGEGRGPVAFGIDLGGFSLADFATTAQSCARPTNYFCLPMGVPFSGGSPGGSPGWGASPPGLGRRAGFPAPPTEQPRIARDLEKERFSQLEMVKRRERAEVRAERKADPTTLMLRNIPNKVTEEKLKEFLDDTSVRGTYDIVHLPTDVKSGHNRGYAFVNFYTAEQFHSGMAELRNLRFAAMQSRKVTETSVAHVQGRRAIERIQSGQKSQKKK